MWDLATFIQRQRDARDSMAEAVRQMEAGAFRCGETRAGVGNVDTTDEWIAELKARTVNLDLLISKAEGVLLEREA